MKYCLYLVLLFAFQCEGCEPATLETLRKDVEQAFMSKSFSTIAGKYAGAEKVEIVLENEYDDENPTMTLSFSNLTELSKWFFEKHEFTDSMIIPAPVTCRGLSCEYQVPELTLHHATYLQGFQSRKVGQCTALTQIQIYWG